MHIPSFIFGVARGLQVSFFCVLCVDQKTNQRLQKPERKCLHNPIQGTYFTYKCSLIIINKNYSLHGLLKVEALRKLRTWYQLESGHAKLGYPSRAECIHNMPPPLFGWNKFSFVLGVPNSINDCHRDCEQRMEITISSGISLRSQKVQMNQSSLVMHYLCISGRWLRLGLPKQHLTL